MPFTYDTSVVVAALVEWHPLHELARQRMMRDVVALPAHAVFECYSVLTRLPAPHRLEAGVAADAVVAATARGHDMVC